MAHWTVQFLEVFLSGCNGFHDPCSIIPGFNAMPPKDLKITDIQYWFSADEHYSEIVPQFADI